MKILIRGLYSFLIISLILLSAIEYIMSQTQVMIDVNIDLTKQNSPKYLGSSGIRLYAVNSEEKNKTIYIEVNKENETIDLYKVHFDLALFLSNEHEDAKVTEVFQSSAVYGNFEYAKKIIKKDIKEWGCYVIGYLDQDDVRKINHFFELNQLATQEGVRKYYDHLGDKVKSRLKDLLGNNPVHDIHLYMKEMATFYQQCVESKLEVIMVYSG